MPQIKKNPQQKHKPTWNYCSGWPNDKIKYLLYLYNICKIKVHCCIVLPVHTVFAEFRRNLTLTTPVKRWRTLETLNGAFSISPKWDLPVYSTKRFYCRSRPTPWHEGTKSAVFATVSLQIKRQLAHLHFYAPQLVPAGTAEARISYGISVCPSVCLSVCLSRPGTDSIPDEIETPGLHHMIA